MTKTDLPLVLAESFTFFIFLFLTSHALWKLLQYATAASLIFQPMMINSSGAEVLLAPLQTLSSVAGVAGGWLPSVTPKKTKLSRNPTCAQEISELLLVTLTAETHERAVRKCDAGYPRVDADVCHEPGTSSSGGAAAAQSHHEAPSVFTGTSCQQGRE